MARWLPATVAAALSAIMVGAVVWALPSDSESACSRALFIFIARGQAFSGATRQSLRSRLMARDGLR
jgi:hypothetical protein